MKTILCAALLLAACGVFAQAKFPAAWAGKWTGKLEIHVATGKVPQEVPMELHILPLDSAAGKWSWTLIYGENKEAGKRPYELLTLDASKGLYLMDEKNSIRMEAYLLGGKFFQSFEVEGSLLFTSTELVGEELWWEVVSGKMEPASVTGGEKVDGRDISQVKTFPLKTLQRAKMKRS